MHDQKFYILYPESSFSSFWNIINSINLLSSVFTTPYQLAFNDVMNSPTYVGYNNTSNGLFYIDICLNFFSAIETEEFKIEDNLGKIAVFYLKGWFVIDVVAVFPFE